MKLLSSKPVEHGIYVIVLAATFVALLAVLGLAADVIKLHNSKLAVQKAVDAGSVAASYLLQEKSRSTVEDTARRIITDNLLNAGLSQSEINAVSVSTLPSTGAARSVAITASINNKLLLLNLVPGIGQNSVVSASVEAGDKRVGTVLVLDTSASMGVGRDAEVPCGTMSTPSGVCTKLDFLKAAALDFVRLFRTEDRLAVVTFSDSARVLYPMTRNPDKVAIATSINGLTASGLTNPYAALLSARGEMNKTVNSDLIPSDAKAIVIVTDGAPMSDDYFTPPSVPVPPVPSGCLPPQVPESNSALEMRRLRTRYVAALIQSDNARNEGTAVYAIGLGPKGTRDESQGCPNSSSGTWQYYSQSDPYQCANHDEIVKTFFLGRLTNDQDAMAGDPTVVPRAADPDFPVSCVPRKSQIVNLKQGKFFYTNEVRDLSPLLTAIGKNISAILKR